MFVKFDLSNCFVWFIFVVSVFIYCKIGFIDLIGFVYWLVCDYDVRYLFRI